MQKVSVVGHRLMGLYTQANGRFKVRKVVPLELRKIVGKDELVRSLKTTSFEDAVRLYAGVMNEFDAILTDAKQGVPPSRSSPTLERLQSLAKGYGLPYTPASVVRETVDLERFMVAFAAWQRADKPDDARFQALFGEIEHEGTIIELYDSYVHETASERVGWNKRAVDKHLNPKKLAVNELVAFLKDDRLKLVTPENCRRFNSHLKERIKSSDILPATANKQLTHLRVIFNKAIENEIFRGENPFLKFRHKGEGNKRNPYSVQFIRDRILAPGALSGLKVECRGLIWAMIDTGAGPGELCGLDPVRDIVLDGPIPFIRIQPNSYRQLKNDARPRDIPLVGFALKAFQEFPEGFSSYRKHNGPESASANCNKYLKAKYLIEEAEFRNGNESPQTLYSFRHTFADRMKRHNFDEVMRSYLMGHCHPGMGAYYGRGYEFERVHAAMLKLESDFQ